MSWVGNVNFQEPITWIPTKSLLFSALETSTAGQWVKDWKWRSERWEEKSFTSCAGAGDWRLRCEEIQHCRARGWSFADKVVSSGKSLWRTYGRKWRNEKRAQILGRRNGRNARSFQVSLRYFVRADSIQIETIIWWVKLNGYDRYSYTISN